MKEKAHGQKGAALLKLEAHNVFKMLDDAIQKLVLMQNRTVDQVDFLKRKMTLDAGVLREQVPPGYTCCAIPGFIDHQRFLCDSFNLANYVVE